MTRGDGYFEPMTHRVRIRTAIVVPCLCILAVAQVQCDRGDGTGGPQLPRVEINGHVWRVETATTRATRYQGLAGRGPLDADRGMLFIYPQPDVLGFCMRGCYIPLDIAFIDGDLRVVRIHTMAVEPGREGTVTYSSDQPAMYALEVGAGELARAKVRVGQKVTFLGPMPNPDLAESDE